MDVNLLKAGKIINTHALKGEVRVFPYCDSAEFLCDFDELYINETKYDVLSARVHKGQALIKFKGIDTIEKAEETVGSIIYIDKRDVELEDGRFFIEDIKGTDVYDIDTNVLYGKVTNIIQTGANDVFEVTSPDGKQLLVPKIDDVVKEINLEKNIILIQPMKGLFE